LIKIFANTVVLGASNTSDEIEAVEKEMSEVIGDPMNIICSHIDISTEGSSPVSVLRIVILYSCDDE